MASSKLVGFIVYLIFALYFVNSSLNLIELPGFFENIHKWIVLIGGILILVGGINYLRANVKKHPS